MSIIHVAWPSPALNGTALPARTGCHSMRHQAIFTALNDTFRQVTLAAIPSNG
jgi:hypothetical protein